MHRRLAVQQQRQLMQLRVAKALRLDRLDRGQHVVAEMCIRDRYWIPRFRGGRREEYFEVSFSTRGSRRQVFLDPSAAATAVRMSATENGFVTTSWTMALRPEARSR